MLCSYKKGLKSLLIPEYAHETLQHISYIRNLEIRDFGEAQEISTGSSKASCGNADSCTKNNWKPVKNKLHKKHLLTCY